MIDPIVVETHRDHAVIYSVAVDPDWQRQGVGPRLMAFAKDRAVALRLTDMRPYANALMERNISRYRRQGYRKTGWRPSAHSAAHPIMDMIKRLN